MALEKHMLQTHSLFEKAGEVFEGVAKLKQRIAELEAERDAFEKSFNEMTEEFMKSQRALWLVRAIAAKRECDYWYHVHLITRSLDGEWFKVNHRGQGHLGLYKRPIECVKTWDKVRELCSKKAEEYK